MATTICPECRIGRLRPITTTYLHWLGENMMVLPNVPAYSCDMCQHMHYDPHFMHHLQFILDQLSEDAPEPNPEQARSSVARRSNWQPPTRGSI